MRLRSGVIISSLVSGSEEKRIEYRVPPFQQDRGRVGGPIRRRRIESNEYIEGWEELLEAGIWIGPRDAEYILLEFGDLECPACRTFHLQLTEARRKLTGGLALVFLHFPLRQNRLAPIAARALECADEQDRAEAFLDVVYLKQDSLGLKSWPAFADEAALPAPRDFLACLDSSSAKTRISAGLSLGKLLDVRGTPTLVLNGWRYAEPSELMHNLSHSLELIRRGEPPFAEYVTRALYLPRKGQSHDSMPSALERWDQPRPVTQASRPSPSRKPFVEVHNGEG